jgi:hypothetical protein
MVKRKNEMRRWARKTPPLAALLIVFGLLFLVVNVFPVAQVRHEAAVDVSSLGERLGQAAGQAGETIGQAAGDLGQSIGEAAGNLGESVGEAAGNLGESIGQAAGDFGQSVGEAFSERPAPHPVLPGLWPLLLIAVGLYLLLRRPISSAKAKHDDYDDNLV